MVRLMVENGYVRDKIWVVDGGMVCTYVRKGVWCVVWYGVVCYVRQGHCCSYRRDLGLYFSKQSRANNIFDELVLLISL